MDPAGVWFALIAFLLTGYAVLDGLDAGSGALHLLGGGRGGPPFPGTGATLRGVGLVWLLAGIGAARLVFPALGTAAGGVFFLAPVVLLATLLLRAVATLLRPRGPATRSPSLAAGLFAWSGLAAVLVGGLAVGDLLRGLPVTEAGAPRVGLSLLDPYALLAGLTALALLMLHGAAWESFRSSGEARQWAERWAVGCWLLFVVLWLVGVLWTLLQRPSLVTGSLDRPTFWFFLIVLLGATTSLPRNVRRLRHGRALAASSLMVVGQAGLVATGIYPALLPARAGQSGGLTIGEAAPPAGLSGGGLLAALTGLIVLVAVTALACRRGGRSSGS